MYRVVQKLYILQHTISLEPFKTDFTKIFLEFLGMEIRLQFVCSCLYSLQISSVLLYRKMATFDGFSTVLSPYLDIIPISRAY